MTHSAGDLIGGGGLATLCNTHLRSDWEQIARQVTEPQWGTCDRLVIKQERRHCGLNIKHLWLRETCRQWVDLISAEELTRLQHKGKAEVPWGSVAKLLFSLTCCYYIKALRYDAGRQSLVQQSPTLKSILEEAKLLRASFDAFWEKEQGDGVTTLSLEE